VALLALFVPAFLLITARNQEAEIVRAARQSDADDWAIARNRYSVTPPELMQQFREEELERTARFPRQLQRISDSEAVVSFLNPESGKMWAEVRVKRYSNGEWRGVQRALGSTP
jgi:hypothetical protein